MAKIKSKRKNPKEDLVKKYFGIPYPTPDQISGAIDNYAEAYPKNPIYKKVIIDAYAALYKRLIN